MASLLHLPDCKPVSCSVSLRVPVLCGKTLGLRHLYPRADLGSDT